MAGASAATHGTLSTSFIDVPPGTSSEVLALQPAPSAAQPALLPVTRTVSRDGLRAIGVRVAWACARLIDAVIAPQHRKHQVVSGVVDLAHAQPELCKNGGRQPPFVGLPAACDAPILLQTRPRRTEIAALQRLQHRRKLYKTSLAQPATQTFLPLRSLIKT